ncbi:hypothetical protein NLX83_09325 [Allokutzneria sp. A3M-2-11 16]|uniref:hypothetical protein n=1 Tax=Allokutzneria sp. A3M-2-11 16 TaxID=2962043 RepID=UPI0020B8ED90|nr:hypothetical protein [Allokutzneria sp. A3M-2-11 16]MCP3799456.1 hypothetical protein [Allokutzneria sp. A3M-2-11 16]
MTSNQSANTGGGRVRRLLTRALLVAGTAATGWLVASGTAAAADAPLLPAPLDGVVDSIADTAKPVADATESTVATVVEQIVSAPSKARSLAVQDDDNALNGAVEGLAGLLKPKQHNLIDVPTAVLESVLTGSGSARSAATAQDAGTPQGDPAAPPKTGGPAKNDAGHPVDLPPAVVNHGPAAGDTERPQPGEDEGPRYPLPSAPVQIPGGSCSCPHDGPGTGGFNVGGFLSAAHNLVVRGQALSAAALHRMAAATAKQPGTTPD